MRISLVIFIFVYFETWKLHIFTTKNTWNKKFIFKKVVYFERSKNVFGVFFCDPARGQDRSNGHQNFLKCMALRDFFLIRLRVRFICEWNSGQKKQAIGASAPIAIKPNTRYISERNLVSVRDSLFASWFVCTSEPDQYPLPFSTQNPVIHPMEARSDLVLAIES